MRKVKTMSSTRQSVVNIALTYDGAKKGSKKHHKLVDTFNKVKPHGEVGNYSCSWCAITWTAWQILAGNTQKDVPMSYNCGTLINDAKALGIWKESDSFVPSKGDGIIYDWSDDGRGENKDGCDHVGLVYKVDSKYIYVIEGNMSTTSKVGRRKIAINGRFIRGFIHPKYALNANQKARRAAVAWAKKIAADNRYGYKFYDKNHSCPFCHPGEPKGFSCIGLVTAAYAHGAEDPTMKRNCSKNNGAGFGNNYTFTHNLKSNWLKHNGKHWKLITNGGAQGGKDVPRAKLWIGDVLVCYDGKGKYKHLAIYVGKGMIVDATSSRGVKVRSYAELCRSLHVSRVFRYTGKGKY